MTSIFDQEQASQRYKGTSQSIIRPELSTTGFIHMKLEEEPPIFSKQKVNFVPTDPLTHLTVSNDVLLLAMSNSVLLRIDLKNPENPEEIDLKKSVAPMQICGMFLDPTGRHLLISTRGNGADGVLEVLYLPQNSQKPKQLSKFRGHIITAVGWNFGNNSETTTGPILLGTSKGLIFETEIGFDGNRMFQTINIQYWKQVFDIGKGSTIPVTGLEFHRVPDSEKYFVIVTTPSRLYQFIGEVRSSEERPLLQHIFSSYLNVPEKYKHLPNTLSHSCLQFYYPSPRELPRNIGWLAGQGISFGKINAHGKTGHETVIVDEKLLQCPPTDTSSPKFPQALILTEFHALVLYSDRIRAFCVLNEEQVYEDVHNENFGDLINITRDPLRGTIWAFSEKAVHKIKVLKEGRNAWQVFVDKGDFELAKEYCRDNPVHYDQVLVKQAESYFEKKNYLRSAEIFAKTKSSFEEVALKFLQVWEIDALKTLLQKKLESLQPKDKTQQTMLVIWLLELMLNELGNLRDAGQEDIEKYQILQQQLHKFMEMRQIKECLKNNRSTVYSLLASHGDKDNLIYYAVLMEDFERVVKHHLQKHVYSAALEVLQKQSNVNLIYQYTPVLMQFIPKQTVDMLISQGRSLNPSKLIPALVVCNQSSNEEQGNEAIKYLEYCIYKLDCKEQSIHNYLVYLYARLKPEKLLPYIVAQGTDPTCVQYDMRYALRVCQERNLVRPCVQLSALLGLWESAVDLALQVSVDLAKQTASLPQDDPELKKKLWLKIAQHVVKDKNDIGQAMQFLQQCDLIKIEDILPFFPDFVTIDHFKDAICSSLQEYNQHIQDLKEEMEEATKTAEVIREEIQSFRNRYAFVKPQDKCNLCKYSLLTRSFYLFPCGHRFHSDCLTEYITPCLPQSRRKRLQDLKRQLQTLFGREETASLGSTSLSTRDQIKADIDDIVASECVYCGEMMIRSIDQSFFEDGDFDRITKEWD